MSSNAARNMSVKQALSDFIAHYLKSYPRLEEIFDPQWRSPCEIGEAYRGDDGIERILWQPLTRHPDSFAEDFAGLERALELTIHPDIKAYYGSFYSAGLEAEAPDGHVSLIQLWNNDDLERLIENLIGHSLAKHRSKSPFTVFFACTDVDSDLFLSVENHTGKVFIEKPGDKPLRQVANSLAEFLDVLAPATPDTHPERLSLR